MNQLLHGLDGIPDAVPLPKKPKDGSPKGGRNLLKEERARAKSQLSNFDNYVEKAKFTDLLGGISVTNK